MVECFRGTSGSQTELHFRKSHSLLKVSGLGDAWCPGQDSNLHALRRGLLRPLCLPIPPPGRMAVHETNLIFGPEGSKRRFDDHPKAADPATGALIAGQDVPSNQVPSTYVVVGICGTPYLLCASCPARISTASPPTSS